jgi:threonine dehydrogenase-like Zn-dependent dehydrogenase
MTLEQQPEPVAEPGTVVVRVVAAGICGSDVTAYLGHMGISQPGQVRGHEFAGIVVDAVAENADWLNLPVTVNPLVSCGICRACRAGHDNQCANQVSLGIQRPGAFAEFVAVPIVNLVALTPNVDLRAAATAEPLAQGIHDVRLALRDGPVDVAVVIGGGSIGMFVVTAAQLLGISEIIVLEPNADRHEAIRRAGGTVVLGSRDEVTRHLHERGTLGADAVFDVVGIEQTRKDAITWTARGGTAVFVGLHEDSSELPWRDLLRREITVRCANASDRDDFRLAADWLSNGLADLPDYRTDSLENAPAVFASLADGSAPAGVKVILEPSRPR